MKNPIYFCIFLPFFFYSCDKKESEDPKQPTTGIIFEKSIGGALDDYVYDGVIHQDALYAVGTTHSLGEPNGDLYLIKMDLDGHVLWERTYGGSATDEGAAIHLTNDGHLILAGATQSSGNGMKDIHLLKLTTNGDVIWEKTIGGSADDTPITVIETANNSFCIAGTTESYGAGSRDIYVVWVDQNGNTIREKHYGGTDIDGSTELLEIENNELMLYGYTANFGANSRDLYLMKLSANGDSLWSKRYGGSGYEESQDFVRTPSGGFVLQGHSSSIDPIHNMFTVKVDANGNVIWEVQHGGRMHDGGQAIGINEIGQYVLIGRSMSFRNGDRNIYMVTTDTDGNTLSEVILGGERDDWGQHLIVHNDHYYILGHTNSFNDNANDAYVLKYRR
jgi:hypothetical protein